MHLSNQCQEYLEPNVGGVEFFYANMGALQMLLEIAKHFNAGKVGAPARQ